MTPLYGSLSTLKKRAFSPSIMWNKSALREAMRLRRSRQDTRAARLKNRRISERMLSLPELNGSNCIALYASTPDEVQTDSIASLLLQNGKTLAYPAVVGNDLHFRRVSDLKRDLCGAGSFGIREPHSSLPDIPLQSIDLFVTPGIAFDPFGGRVGYGGGYYDRILSQKRPDALAVAAAFEFQVVHAIQLNDYDRSVNRIVTEDTLYSPNASTCECPTEEDTRAFAQSLLQEGLSEGCTLALHADLGVGKTVLTQGLAKALGAQNEVVSPTFIYCRQYEGRIPLLHVDAYRLDGVAEGDEPFWDEILESPGIRIIEWAERLGERLPKSAIHCFGDIRENERRRVWTLVSTITPTL